MNMQVTTNPNTFIPTTDTKNVVQVPEWQMNDGKQLLRDDIGTDIKTRILQFQVAKSIIANEKANVTTGALMRNLNTQKTFVNYEENTKHFAVTTNKMAIAHLLVQDLDSGKIVNPTLPLPPADQRIPGTGKYDQPDAPNQASLKELFFDMLNRSGNTAVRVLVDAMGGPTAVNDRLAQIPEIPNTRLVPVGQDGRFFMGDTTTKEALFLLEQMYFHNGVNADFVKQALRTNIFSDYGVRSQLGDTDRIVLTNNTGMLNDPDGNSRHDIGIVRNYRSGISYSYAIMTTSRSSNATARAETSIQEMGRTLLRFAGDKREDARKSPTSPSQHSPKTDRKILY